MAPGIHLLMMFFFFSSLCVAPLLYHIYGITWDDSIQGGEDFATCLVKASITSLDPRYGVDQTQDAVNAFAKEVCGSVPGNRPNQAMVSGM